MKYLCALLFALTMWSCGGLGVGSTLGYGTSVPGPVDSTGSTGPTTIPAGPAVPVGNCNGGEVGSPECLGGQTIINGPRNSSWLNVVKNVTFIEEEITAETGELQTLLLTYTGPGSEELRHQERVTTVLWATDCETLRRDVQRLTLSEYDVKLLQEAFDSIDHQCRKIDENYQYSSGMTNPQHDDSVFENMEFLGSFESEYFTLYVNYIESAGMLQAFWAPNWIVRLANAYERGPIHPAALPFMTNRGRIEDATDTIQ